MDTLGYIRQTIKDLRKQKDVDAIKYVAKLDSMDDEIRRWEKLEWEIEKEEKNKGTSN